MIFRDGFAAPRRASCVVGSHADGIVRRGIDKEGVLSIDNSALRIQPLIEAGWQRACLSYGPTERKAGLVFVVHMLNGHNTAQAEPLGEPFENRVRTWLFGSKTLRVRHRLWRLVRTGRLRRVLRQMRWWKALDRRDALRLDENLAIGWYAEEVADPVHAGASLIMHATGAENGELWAGSANGFGPTVREVQNLPIYYAVALRERDVAYFVGATLPGAHALPEYPYLRPIGIGPLPAAKELWASIHQSVIGQGGFRCDTRIYGTSVAELEEFRGRFGGAVFGESFVRDGSIATDERWIEAAGALVRTDRGFAAEGRGAAITKIGVPAGLVRAQLHPKSGRVGIWFRVVDAQNYWDIAHDGERFELAIVTTGARTVIAVDPAPRAQLCDLQIMDDGRTFALRVGSRLLFDRRFEDPRYADADGIGIACEGSVGEGPWISELEVFPRELALPDAIDLGRSWLRTGTEVVVADDFSGPAGPLEGRMTTTGGRRWTRVCGDGHFDLSGDGELAVRATRTDPCPGRTFYTIDWTHEDFADLEVTITPPGTGRGNRDYGLVGFVLWQDESNYVAINTWLSDSYPGASTSSFFTVGGWEDLYDAVWSNVGDRIRHGVPCRLRVVFDGLTYVVFIDGVPVLYRKLTDIYADCPRLRIRRVGLLANWEWGLDTGSKFRAFLGRI